jgi:hypothetical protein
MSMKRKWLRILMLVLMGGASFVGAKMNPKEIEDVLHIMNETKVEFTIPDENHKGDGDKPSIQTEPIQSPEPGALKSEDNYV